MKTDCDLLVIGSGAAGLCAAVTGAAKGLRVIVAEKATVYGGTTAWAGGWIWAPGNPAAQRLGIAEPIDAPRQYLKTLLGSAFDAERVEAFLTFAPRAIEFLETEAGLSFECGSLIPDTYSEVAGAGQGGRSVIAAPYNARDLGPLLHDLRPPLRETSFWGLPIQAGSDLRAFMSMTRSPKAFLYVASRMARHLWDLAFHRRAMQLRNGNALMARLLRAATDLGVNLRKSHTATRLLQHDGRVSGAIFATLQGEVTITAGNVVLAAGGLARDASLAAPHSLAVPEATGDSARIARAVGARIDCKLAARFAQCPVSIVPYPNAASAVFPHIIERGKPGIIGVLANGQRFCNEGLGYHDYVVALNKSSSEENPVSWLICDHRFQRRYGLGIARPAPLPLGKLLRSGYLVRSRSLSNLAAICGIDPQGLLATVASYNHDAVSGKDSSFGRGETAYARLQGDPNHTGPNPCMAPIAKAPFYAVKIVAGSFGAFIGLKTDAAARVLDAEDKPIAGLYAAGTDMASVFGGFYPAGGINIGPALTFGHIAALHAAGCLEEPR